MQYWHELITKKSFEVLKKLRKNYEFILIGGWACFLYTKSLKSKDIDLVIDYEELEKFKKDFSITKNERLKKYSAKVEDIDIDIYVPFFSDPGIPVEEIKNYVTSQEGFSVPAPELLLILKQRAFEERKDSPKGEKDKLDIFSLLNLTEIDWKKYKKLLKKYNRQSYLKDLIELLKDTYEIKQIGLNRHKIAKLKKIVLEKLE